MNGMVPVGWIAKTVLSKVMAAVKAREAAQARGVTDKRELDRIGMAAYDAATNVIPFPKREVIA